MRKLGLIAGGGDLPATLARHCRTAGRPVFVLRLRGFASGDFQGAASAEVGLGELGRCFDLLRRERCAAVCFAGNVARPDFSALRPDLRGIRALPAVIAAARKGDDALLRAVLGEFEREGFVIEGAQDVHDALLLPLGPVGAVEMQEAHTADAALALKIARASGALDIGQAAVVAAGLVLAVEAQEGTDAMLHRCAALPEALRGRPGGLIGVLAKAPKPDQERRVDLPTLGVATLEGAAAAGLAGVVGEAGATLTIDRARMIATADRLGLFVVGMPATAEAVGVA